MKDGKKAAIVLTAVAGAGAVAVWYFTRKEAFPPVEPPPPPGPGLATLYGVVIDSRTGIPIKNVLVQLDGISTYTDINGYYEIANIEPGEYDISFSIAGYTMA